MNLYIVRHAHAVTLQPPELEADEDRPLSEQGREQVQALAAAIRHAGIRFNRMVASPLLRARQTAEDLQRALLLPPETVEISETLAPGASRKQLAKHLRRLAADSVAVIGHEPDLSRFLSWLIGSKRAQIELAKGGMASVICEEPPRKKAGRLEWLLTPAWLPKSAVSQVAS